MNKYEFLYRLDKALTGFQPHERKEITGYYDELIQDAVDSGEPESAFIDRLGSIETIVRTIRRDGSFLSNVREKKDFQLRRVFDAGVKVLGYALFGVVAFAAGTAAFVLAVTGISAFFAAIVGLIRDSVADPSTATLIMYAGGILIGTGLFLGGVAGFRWIFGSARGIIDKTMEIADKIVGGKDENGK